MNGPKALAQARALCAFLDRRWAGWLAPVALSLSLGLPACDDSDEVETICNDSEDNDGDGRIDCADDDCLGEAYCTSAYAVAFEICTNGLDDDNDGAVDCADADCLGQCAD